MAVVVRPALVCHGVRVLQARAFSDPTSWWTFAAIHGFGLDRWREVGLMPATPPPGAGFRNVLWDQCQHQSWYFLPWHRGYVLALEEEVRAAVVASGGPEDWALPYWNYFRDPAIPPAFTEVSTPDGAPNPLRVRARFGPAGDGVIRIPRAQINARAMQLHAFTGTRNGSPGFGGLDTGFSHEGETSGALESQPHNVVHVLIGGRGVLDGRSVSGVMSDPRTAGLDPVFWLHHANIDRMWAAWNAAGEQDPRGEAWLEGPTARRFALPRLSGKIEEFEPSEMRRIDDLGYGYDSLDVGAVAVTTAPEGMQRPSARKVGQRWTVAWNSWVRTRSLSCWNPVAGRTSCGWSRRSKRSPPASTVGWVR
ncbi:hypothetical protein GCM10025864_25670 [Luteimicrobium album]|uniref:Tyrosinase copper-binding domain-containing protein n=1 Tax=Luteimicrobium album TaxID=1054550 RepID=A0ABQ6I216_9MICO|nr:tyrosinase family protein [Luteimicrobium album]GMA24808.1 hypothetical protein GCM10025864_25670 [Luteimicrobium album]